MEARARRRAALLSSHLCPTPPVSETISPVSVSSCSSSSGAAQNDCVFCKIVRGDAPALKVYEDDVCLCILDINPLSRGHSLIIPKLHFPNLEATPPYVVAKMFSKVPVIGNAVMKATESDSFNLLVNNGEAAGQVILHTHIHIIPRTARDCLWASESLGRKELKFDHEALQLACSIRERLPFLEDSFLESKLLAKQVL
ncbi:unnamed protein product [Cuscuta epithymum]|uniref:HIT domain-containing protein n=1 Tax=Cuscuta epithymum TaxID=186058 RepID=A0AAV0CCQ0_9ASTE|nr:unnamed protein product [Cuscuta epithymum]